MDVQQCAACQFENALPFLFCEHCGAPRARLGWLRMFINLTLAMAAFLITYLAAGNVALPWDWPLYTFYAFFLYQFISTLVAGRWGRTLKVKSWFAGSYLFFMVLFTVYSVRDSDPAFFIHLLGNLPDWARDYPTLFYPILGGVLTLLLVPFYFRWMRLYGWHNAYRIVMLALFTLGALVLLTGRLLEWIHQRNLIPSIVPDIALFLKTAKPHYDYWVGLFTLITIRILIFEVFISAALNGYRRAAGAHLPDVRARLGGEGAFIRSLVTLGQVLRRFFLLLEGMAHSVLETLATLGRCLWEVALAFLRDLFIPTLALAGAGTLLYFLVLWTKDYVAENTLVAIFRLLGALLGLLVCTMIFIACATTFQVRRIVRFTAEFGGWLMPNLLVFFLLISLSLYMTGRLLNDEANERIPFRLGLLTRADAAVLALLVGVVLWRRRALFQVEAAPHAASAAPPPQPQAAPAEKTAKKKKTPKEEKPEPAPEGGSFLTRLKNRACDTVTGSVRAVSDRVQGKSAIVDQLARVRQKREEKAAQLRSLEKIQGTIAAEAFENLWNQSRSELTFLEVEQARLQTELDTQYAEHLMEKATLEGRLASLNLEKHESDAEPSPEEQKAARAVMEEIENLMKKIEVCERTIESLAPHAGQSVAVRSGSR